ncbi:hypothetical protein T07_6957 [Trichinella nelsoni]|uniref:Uncharacterized protein n=1 Tax=Trichinella nelsoni TaxID=6336 RepID=A0A0V0RBE8_9BILA|nr:hypothetical protein T07_6957 [Trichinella nelsoni]
MLYAQQHFTSCFISALSRLLHPESRIHHNFSRQISDDDI